MLLVAVEFAVNPSDAEAFTALARDLTVATRAEPGCRFFELWCDPAGPGRFHLCEGWDGRDALLAHRQQPHVAGFKAATASLDVRITEVRRYEASETEVEA